MWSRFATLLALGVAAAMGGSGPFKGGPGGVVGVGAAPVATAAVGAMPPLPAKHQVQLQVAFRAFCPACQWFVGDPLLELVRNEQFRRILDFRLFPAAGMLDHGTTLECEGGDEECEGHRWQICVIDRDRKDVLKYLGGIACIEGDESGEVGEWGTKLNNCFTPQEREDLKECFDKRSEDLLRGLIRQGVTSVDWMPYTQVNGVVLGSATTGVGLSELQSSVCSAFKGPKKYYPDVCLKVVGEQKEFAPEEPEPSVTAKAETTSTAPTASVAKTTVNPPAPAEGAKKLDVTPKVLEPAEPVVDNGEEGVEPPVNDDTGGASDKVSLAVYWRAFCPGCMSFVTKPLLKLLRDEQFRDIIDFHPVPAAGTFFDSTGNFICNKGMVECVGHRWLSCVIEEFPKVEEQIEHLACLESRDNKGSPWNAIITKCFTTNAREKMQQCFDNKSTGLLKKYIAQREKVDILWVPYVLVNGQPIGDARHGIGYKQLQDEICKNYKGNEEHRPVACQPKRLRNDDTHDNKETDAPVIKPCPPKKEGKGAKTVDPAAYKDAPGGAFRRPTDIKEERALTGDGEKGLKDMPAEGGGFRIQSLLFPVGCFVILGLVARQFSGDHKKNA